MTSNTRQVCDRCGGRFGMVTHRWWGKKFCKKVCKEAHLREVAISREALLRWFGPVEPAPRAAR